MDEASWQLKQLCTNLVVKLDLPMDVADIDGVVKQAGAFSDDPNAPATGANEWNLDQFQAWFVEPGHFNVDKEWIMGDESDEDETPNAEKPFLNGTYIGIVEGADGKKWTGKYLVGAKPGAGGKLEGGKTKTHNEFKTKIRIDADKPPEGAKVFLKERPGCDSIGFFRCSGFIEGDSIEISISYDVDNDASTKEPILVLTGKWGGADAPNDIVGTWKNGEPEAAAKMEELGLGGCQDGTFKLSKRIRPDE